MGRISTFIIGAVSGLILGGILTFYLLVGVPQAVEKPGEIVRPPDAGEQRQTGTAQIVLNEAFFNSVLQTIFKDMKEPEFPLQIAAENRDEKTGAVRYGLLQNKECGSRIKLLREGSGVQTGVRFTNGRMTVPLAFSGSARVFGSCLEFKGWSQANLELRFDRTKQSVYGVVNVETVNLDGISPLITNAVTPLIQTTLNQRVNPVEILNGKQIAVNLPIAATDGNLLADISDVRAEVKDNALNLFITYDFRGKPRNQ